MNVFDRLQKKLEVDQHEGGISPLDLADLPPELRKIMRFMLREVELSYSEICEAVGEMDDLKMKQKQLDEALQTLTRQGWLILRGEGERMRYQVNLRHKPGSKLAIWGLLDDKIHTPQSAPPQEKK